MHHTRKNKGGSLPRRQTRRTRTRTPNPYKVAAKAYVEEIKDLRVELKAIQKMYRDADIILNNQPNEKDKEKAMNDKENAKLDMIEKHKNGFPLPKKDGVEIGLNNRDIFRIIKKIPIKERWNIIATGYLMIRPLEQRRRRMENALAKFEGSMEPIEFRNQLEFFRKIISYSNPNEIIDGSDLSGPYGHAAPPAYKNPGPSYKSEKSSKYGFPTSTPPPEYPPPNYEEGGSRRKRKNKTKLNKLRKTKRRYTRK